jgi:adenylate cyclase
MQKSVRVRVAGTRGLLTVKGKTRGLARDEFEYEIPVEDARAMLATLAGPAVTKLRYEVPVGPHTWEVDVFQGDNEGLVVAEIELTSEDEAFERPSWVGEEVTRDARYLNTNLAAQPFRSWR